MTKGASTKISTKLGTGLQGNGPCPRPIRDHLANPEQAQQLSVTQALQ
jgi:hypothetical protein